MNSINKLAMPVALGLSLVSVTAAVVYYVLVKDGKDEGKGNKTETAGSKPTTTPTTSTQGFRLPETTTEDVIPLPEMVGEGEMVRSQKVNVIELKVPKEIVPALIGRAGSNIKDIERKSGALISFKKFTDKDYDICIMRGRRTATQIAETMVLEFIKQQPLIVEDKLMVPNWTVGRIIGSGGETINDISHRSGARVKVDSRPTDKVTQRLITIKGTKEQIQVAKELIGDCVAQEKCRREIEQSKSPRNVPRSPSGSPRQESPEQDQGETPTTTPHAKYKMPESSTPAIEVYVSAVSSPSRFWVQFVGPQVAQLDELVAQMTDFYNNKENRELHAVKQAMVGQIVAAVFRHDGRWYRARVDDIRPNEFDATQQVADCFFVDYGDSEYVSVHELCELRAELLRLRFQAMECFLAGVRPAGAGTNAGGDAGAGAGGDAGAGEDAQKWERWPAPAIERFEELAQVARWKPLLSRTCTYKKRETTDGEKEREIPGIKLYDVTDEGELDIGQVLIEQGLAVAGAPVAHSTRPAPAPPTPFGDLGNSRVLGMLSGARCSSLPKDHKDDRNGHDHTDELKEDGMTPSKSLASLPDKPLSISNLELSCPDHRPHSNGSQENFLDIERSNLHNENSASAETLTPCIAKIQREEAKANMNRIDSHHSNLEALGRSTHELH